MTEMVGVVEEDKATIEDPIIVKFVRTFTVLGKIKMVVKMMGNPHLQVYNQDLPGQDTNNTELLLARMEGSDAYMVVKKVQGIEGFIFCDVLRRSHHNEVSKEVMDFVGKYVNNSVHAVRTIYVPINGHDRVNCAIRGAEKVWVAVEWNKEKLS